MTAHRARRVERAGDVDDLTVESVPAEAYRARCAAALEAGERFCGLHVRRIDGGLDVVAVFADGARTRAIIAPCHDTLDTLVEIAPAADWDEREAHDLYGVDIRDRRPLRPLVAHTDDLAAWVTPVAGSGTHQVAVGPIHAGVIESGHFRFHVVGERVLHLDLRLFYKHRGLERAAEGLGPQEALTRVGRACAACWVANTVAFAQAWEAAEGLRPASDLARARTLLLELERLYNHLHDLAAACAGVGFATGSMVFAALKERAQQLNARLTGHRFLFGSVHAGRSDLVVGADGVDAMRSELAAIGSSARRAWREMLFTSSVQDRLGGVGVLTADGARRLGTVGPALRATGVPLDLRTSSPRLRYAGVTPVVPESPAGDVAARVEMRALELESTLSILDGLLDDGPIGAAGTTRSRCAGALGVSGVEGPRGESWCTVTMEDGRVRRVHLRTASLVNWPAVAHVAADSLIGDFPLINKSFELCYACADR